MSVTLVGKIAGPLLNANSISGTTTNDNAAAGQLGEFVTSTVAVGSAVSLTTATPANVTSIALTAGDWDVSAQVDLNLTGATGTLFQSGPSLTTATLPTQAGGSGLGTDSLVNRVDPTTTLTGVIQLQSLATRVSLASSSTLFLVASATFSVGTVAAFGTIRARRVR